MKQYRKKDFPVKDIRRFMEPGPSKPGMQGGGYASAE